MPYISKSDAEFLIGIANENHRWLRYYWSGENPKNTHYNKEIGDFRLGQIAAESSRVGKIKNKILLKK